jgi:hypothetical protein
LPDGITADGMAEIVPPDMAQKVVRKKEAS